jgi:cation diffusion facilitator CzcD-associated flavoprotein CzcO
VEEFETVILGAGFSGLGAAIELTRAGRHSFIILEKGEDVGGTWRDNVYPGVECDIPSHLYAYSFAANPDWSKTYAPGAEIHEYLRWCARKYGLLDRIAFASRAIRARWQKTHWITETADGRCFRSRFLISGLGGLHTPNIPDLPGAGCYAGATFHTSNWRSDVPLDGKRVGMIGTGASAVQAAPEVAKVASTFTLFQRSPVWVGPKADKPYGAAERQEFRQEPGSLRRHRWELWRQGEFFGADLFATDGPGNRKAAADARHNIAENVRKSELVEALTPQFNFACKRPTISSKYYPMFNRPNVELVTTPIEGFDRSGIMTGGRVIELDVVVYATGFKPFNVTREVEIVGLSGLSLRDAWSERVLSYRSVMVPNFPNLFLVLGPNSSGLTSAIQMIEAGSRFAARMIAHVAASGGVGIHPSEDAAARFTSLVDRATASSPVNQGCRSWWTSEGNHVLWPLSSINYRVMLSRFMPADFTALAS